MAKKTKTRIGTPNRSPKAVEVRYRKQLQNITIEMMRGIKEKLFPLLRALEPQFAADSAITDTFASDISELLGGLMLNITESMNPEGLAQGMAQSVNRVNEKKTGDMVQRISGVSLSRIFNQEGIPDAIDVSVQANIGLIKSIPSEYFQKLETLIFTNTAQGMKASSLIKEIRKLNRSTFKRAKLIARDQTAKLNANINEVRQRNLGVIGYRWSNSRDRRVRGNPSGKYPNAKFNHWKREGKFYAWSDANVGKPAPNGKKFLKVPADGHPGQPVQCRCSAIPVIPVD